MLVKDRKSGLLVDMVELSGVKVVEEVEKSFEWKLAIRVCSETIVSAEF